MKLFSKNAGSPSTKVPAQETDKNTAPASVEDGTAQATANTLNIDPKMEKQVRRKLDMNLIPLVSALYLLAFLDRSNIGNARIAGMETDLHFKEDDYDWLLTIFYISYIVFGFLSVMWKVVPPHCWAAFCVFTWGLVSTTQAAANSWGAMMALRFIMGLSEVAYGPGVPFLLSFFYLRNELGLRSGLFLSAAPLANTFAGALAYGITSGSTSFAKWRILFLVEGLPTVVMAVVAFFFLPDSPEKSRFLSEEERVVARARGVRQAGAATRVGGINIREFFTGLADPKGWILGLMYFSCNVGFSSLPVFLPTILREMGFSSVNAQGLTAPPFFLSFLTVIATTYIADRTQQRGIMVASLTAIGGIGYVILATSRSVAVRYFAIFLAAAGIFPAIGNILPWVINNQGSDTRRGAGIVVLNLIGQCGPLLGTRMYPTSEGPYYVKGQSVCAAFLFFCCFLALALRTLFVWENKKLDRKYGTIAEQKLAIQEAAARGESKGEAVAVENYGPLFRYVL